MAVELPTQSLSENELKVAGIPVDDNTPTYRDAVPTVILGLDTAALWNATESKRFKEMILWKTKLGWTIGGLLHGKGAAGDAKRINYVQLKELHTIVGRFIESENMGIDPKRPTLEPEDIRLARAQLESGIKQTPTGYEAKLLWRSDKRPGPNNREYALQRLLSFERKMQKDPGLREESNKIIQSYIEKGYITKVKCQNDAPHWYLPIFAVQNTNKTRLVWDAAATFNGASLNNMLLKGPDLNEPLWNILHRFRQLPVAVCADVSEMFHRIRVPVEDKGYQRFLWRNNPHEEIIDYEMDVQTFGAASSPCIAQHVKNENAR